MEARIRQIKQDKYFFYNLMELKQLAACENKLSMYLILNLLICFSYILTDTNFKTELACMSSIKLDYQKNIFIINILFVFLTECR